MPVTKSIVQKGSTGVIAGVTPRIGRLLRAVVTRLPFAQYDGYVGAYAEHYRDEYALERGEYALGRGDRASG